MDIKIRLTSIDIGRRNFAQYIEDFSSNEIIELESQYRKLPKNKKRRVKGVMPIEIQEIQDKLLLSGTRVQTGVYNFAKEDEDRDWDIDARKNLLAHLNKYIKLWDSTDIFVIEQQFFNTPSFGKKGGKRGKASGANVDAIKIGEATFMWFLNRYPNKTVTYFGSQYKTQMFTSEIMTKDARKKWTTLKTRELYTIRKDQDMINVFELSDTVKRKQIKTEDKYNLYKKTCKCESIDANELADKIIREKQKLDDISDACYQAQAFKYRTMIACF